MEKFALLDKIEKNLRLQQHALDLIAYDQAKKTLFALSRSRVIQLILLLFSNILIGSFLGRHYTNLPFAIAAGLLILFNNIGIAGAIVQLVIIHQQEFWDNLRGPHKQTGLLQTAALLQYVMIRFTRIRVLAWPLYSVYVMIGFAFFGWNLDWQFQAAWGILFLPVGIWLCVKVRSANLHLKWVAFLLNLTGRRYLLKLMDLNPTV